MNTKEFKRYMQQGLGKCYLELSKSKDISRYKDVVLWGCLHNLSFDTQCEGTRAEYVYNLTRFFHDDDYFVLPTVEEFRKVPQSDVCLFSHFCELLVLFAKNGSKQAHDALLEKYAVLLSALESKRIYDEFDFERDDFEVVCISLTSLGGVNAFLKIAEDLDTLFIQNPHYHISDFECFLENAENTIGKKKMDSFLKRYAEKSSDNRSFYEDYKNPLKGIEIINPKAIVPISPDELKAEVKATGKLSSASSVRFLRTANDEKRKELAHAVLDEPELSLKAELLSVFVNEGFPLNHEEIIEYSRSSHQRLQEVAFRVLTTCRSTAVRQYAEELIREGSHVSSALQMLICNYIPENKFLILVELFKLPVDYQDKSDWHNIGSAILNAYYNGLRLPEEFLLYIYNTTLCSCCRDYAIHELAKHKWFTDDIIEECRYDSNPDVVAYVNRYFKKHS